MTADVPSSIRSFDQATTRACRDLADAILDGRCFREKIHSVETVAAGWAKAGVPLDWIHKQLWESVKLALQSRTHTAIPGGGDPAVLMDTVTTVLATVSATYLGELRGRQSARQRLMSALLNGEDTTAVARESGLAIAEKYAVIAVAVPTLGVGPEPPTYIAERVGAELTQRCGAAALARLSDEGGTIVLPLPRDEAVLDHLLALLSAAARITLTAATTSAAPTDLADAAVHAHELLEVALLFGREGNLHRISDLAAEYQLTRPGPARDQLATILDPLDRAPDLRATLQLHLRGDLNRRVIARRLHVHVNTVEYRLKRVAALTGVDPLTQVGQWQLRCAMVARSRPTYPAA